MGGGGGGIRSPTMMVWQRYNLKESSSASKRSFVVDSSVLDSNRGVLEEVDRKRDRVR